MDATPLECSLRLACAQKKRDDVVQLLQKGADPNSDLAKDINSGVTPLHFACWHGWLDVVISLCEKHSFDTNVVDFNQQTPLHYACRNGHLNIVMLLLKQGCCVDVMDKNKRTPLYHACKKDHIEIVQHFIDQFGITSSCDKIEVLMMACRSGCLKIVKKLIDVEGVGTSLCAKTLILTASENSNMDIASYLIINKGMTIPESIIDKVAFSACASGHLDLLKNMFAFNYERVCSARDPDDQCTLFHRACHNGHIDIVLYLIKQECDLHSTDKHERTPLHFASLNGHLRIVQLLITKFNCESDVKDSQQQTPLHYACKSGKLDVVQYLFDKCGCNPNQMDENQWTPIAYSCKQEHLHIILYFISKHFFFTDRDKVEILKLACKHGKLDMFQNLIEQIDIDDDTCRKNVFTDEYQQDLLCLACKHGHKCIVNYLINTVKLCQPQFTDRSQLIPLKLSLQKNHVDILQYFVENCDINSIALLICKCGELDLFKALIADKMTIRYEGQTTPLHIASLYGHITFVKHLILDQNHDPGVCDENGLTPLHCASLNGHLDIVKFIGEFTDHDPQAITKIFHDHYQNTPLHYACKGGHVDVVKYLVHKKICLLNDRNIEGLTPLHLSCNSRHIDVLEYLTDELECDLNVTDKYGATLLHYASQFGHVHAIEYLINKCKFNPEVKNGDDGNTPLHVACQCGHVHAAEFLIRMRNCNPELVNFDSRTPLHLACECGKLDVVEYLTEIGCSVCVMDCDLRTPIYYSFRNDHMNIISFFINKIQDKYDNSIVEEISNNACEFGRIDLMRQLKTLNFNACHQLFKDNRTALHIVCQHGHIDVAKYLMKESGCNPAAQDIYGQTPLHYAFQYNHIDIVHHFINHCDLSVAIKSRRLDPLEAIAAGINKTPCNNIGKGDLLHLACKAGHLGFVKLLLNFYLYQDQCNLERDKMLLHLACKYGHIDIISYLLDLEEYDKENRDRYNRTPLHFACEGGYLNVVKYLIKEKKCNMCVKDNGNKMPVHYAIKNGYFDVFLYLIEEGTDLGKDDANSVPLLHYAAMLDQKYMASYLIIECSFSSEARDKDKKNSTSLCCSLWMQNYATVPYC